MANVLILMLIAGAVGYWLGRRSMADAAATLPAAVEVGLLSDRAKHEMDDALRRGDKIGAIRTVREDTGSGLKEAKAFVDAYAAKRSERRPGDPIG